MMVTNQKGLDLVNACNPGKSWIGTGDAWYEDYYENKYKGSFCADISCIINVAHKNKPGRHFQKYFEPCGLTQRIAMRYGSCSDRQVGLRHNVPPICFRHIQRLLRLTAMRVTSL